jgi:hypothetical protein
MAAGTRLPRSTYRNHRPDPARAISQQMSLPRRLAFLVAGDSRQSVTDSAGADVWNTLAAKGFADRASIGSVGFWRDIDANGLLVVLPKAFSSPSARGRLQDPGYQREQIYRLIKIFQKIRRETNLGLSSTETNQPTGAARVPVHPVLDAFDAALRLRRDYRQNGVYIKKSAQHARNKPNLPINWSRTMRRSQVVFSNSGIFFPELAHKIRRRDASNPLSLLQISCLKEIFAFTGERNELEHVEGMDKSVFRSVRLRPKSFLRELKASVFDERGRLLLETIAAYFGESALRSSDAAVREELLSYSRDFEDIWEEVLRTLMAPTMRSRALPTGAWCSYPNGSVDDGITPRFDILLESKHADLLVDAKDYRIINGSRLLGTESDYYKQIIYRLLLPTKANREVLNILAFPNLGQKSLFEVRGVHFWRDLPRSRVFVVTVDYDLATRIWLRELGSDVQAAMSDLASELRKFSRQLDAKA